jgi:hypothetical protein
MSRIVVLPEALLTMSAYLLDFDESEGSRCPSMFVYR